MPMPKKKDGEGAADEEATTEEEKLSRDDIVAMINSAVSGHGKRLEKRILDAITASKAPAGEDEEGAQPKPAPAKKQARDEVAELRKMLEDERNQRRMSEAQKQLSEQLTEAGIKPGLQKFVLGHLLHAEKALAFDEAGNPKLTVRRSRAAGSPVEEIEFEDIGAGIKDWLKSEDAKHFLPAPAAKGTAPAAARSTAPTLTMPGSAPSQTAVEHPQDAIERVRSSLNSAGIHIK